MSHHQLARFGVFEMDLETAELRKSGSRIKLQEQPFQLLAVLLENAADVVTREQLRERLWPADTFVDFDHSLNAAVRKLRSVLDDSADTPRFIETLARRGYRFICPVQWSAATPKDTFASESIESGERRRRFSRAWLVVALGVVALGGVGTWMAIRGTGRTPTAGQTPSPIKSVAVLPFINLSGNAEYDYLSDAMSEEIINALARLPELRVVARTSSSAFKGQQNDVREVGKKLGVASVVEGSVQKSGNRLRVSAKLIGVDDGLSLWSDRFDRRITDVFVIQDEIATAVASALQARLAPASKLVRPSTADLEAYALYIRGRDAASARTRERFDQAIAYYRAALDRDQQFAEAWAGLADLYSQMDHRVGLTSLKPAETYRLATEAANKALALDPHLAEAEAAMGHIQTHLGEFAEAEKHLRRAVELNPNSGMARIWYASLLRVGQRFAEAKPQLLRAREVDPVSILISQMCAINLWMMGEYQTAADAAVGGIEVQPEVGELHLYLARSYASMGKHREASEALERGAAAVEKATFTEEERALILALANRKKEAADLLARIERENPRPVAASMVRAHAAVGNVDAAAQWLDKLVSENPEYARLGLDLPPHPAFARFRADPRYLNARKRLGLPNN